MAQYIYTAKLDPRKDINGSIEAESVQDAINKLSRMGYFPISVEEETSLLQKQGVFNLKKIPKKDIIDFTRQLSVLIESGVNIIKAISLISEQTKNKYLKAVINDIFDKIKGGKPLSESISSYPNLFPPLYSAMLHIGEASGSLKEILKRLAEFLEKEDEFRNSVRSALIYPLFVFGVSVLTILVLFIFVIPRIITMFEDMGQALPLPTQILISVSGFLREYWLAILVSMLFVLFMAKRLYQSQQGRAILDKVKLKVLFLGQIILKTEISRFMRTLSLLLSSSMPISSSLEISASVIDNSVFKSNVQSFKNQISSGYSLSAVIRNSKIFPETVINIISVGEEAGTLDSSLLHIAEDYEKQLDRSLKIFTRLLEPVIILVMGLVVFFIVLAMLLPIFQINLIAQ